jgi:acyl carrier protein
MRLLASQAVEAGWKQGPVTEAPSEPVIREWCVAYLSRTLDLPGGQIDPDMEFARLGLDSASSVHFIVELEEWLGLELTPELTFEYPTIAALARHLAQRSPRSAPGGAG